MIVSPAFAAETAHAAGHHGSLFQDPTFWVAIAFCLTIFALVKMAGKAIAALLQSRADGIAAKLDEAKKIREDAEKLLATYREKQTNAQKDIESTLAKAKENAELMKKRAQEDFDAKLKMREAAAENRLNRATQEATDEVRNLAITIATETVDRLLRERLAGDDGKKLIADAIDSLPSLLSPKDLH